jgi:hypothetical protein
MSGISREGPASDELRQVIAYILDTAAMEGTITSLLEEGMIGFAKEMSEIDRRFPGFDTRLRRQIGKEVRRTISRRVSGLRHEFEDLLKSHLTLDDIKTALRFQRDQVVAQLRESVFIESLETDDPRDARLSARMSARMSPEQHAVVANFLQSPCGVKLAPLTRQMETLKYGWMKAIVSDVSQRLPLIGNDILLKHYLRPTRS